ncbi:hypothetical protein OC844_007443 [Tilletia horrida]|nr:hypothetical protein OC844_007443 [Tilletia horrida]
MASLQLRDVVVELACFKLHYDSDNSALLCGTCRSAVDITRLKQHFQKQAHQNAFFIPLPGDAGVQEARAYIGTDISAHWGRLRQLIASLPAVLPPFQLAPLPADGPPHRYLQQKTAWLCSCGHIEVIARSKTDHLRAHPGHAFRPSAVQSWAEKGNWFPVAMAGPMPGQSHLAPGAEPTDPAGAVLLRMVEKKAAAANLDPMSLVPERPTPPELSKTSSPWLRKVRWSVLLAGVDLKAAAALVHQPAESFQRIDAFHPVLGGHEPVDLLVDFKTQAATALLDAYKDLNQRGSDKARMNLHCDEASYIGSKQAHRPLEGSEAYIKQSVGYVAEMAGLALPYSATANWDSTAGDTEILPSCN